jgi:hypothetical protein
MSTAAPTRPLIGFLHTAEVHTATFSALVAAQDAEVESSHVVDASLLDTARAVGIEDPGLVSSLDSHLAQLGKSAKYIVCTCSTIGGLAEARGQAVGIAVVRVDRPMATLAIQSGKSIAVVAALESTFASTVDLLRSVASVEQRDITVSLEPCLQAWALWEAGDVDGYDRCIAAHVDGLDPTYDVVVLAQGSMLGALQFLNKSRTDTSSTDTSSTDTSSTDTSSTDTSRNRVVLASPQLGVAEAIRVVTGKR